jgi:UDP-N-acetylmuramoyl-tripeptide--D-alanyl-D-alanine ligase
LFFALPGARVDGHDFVPEVLGRGAAAAVVSRDVVVPEGLQDRLVRVPDTLRALGASGRAFRREWDGLVIAVTGSNGKTTTREMIHHILSKYMPCKRSPKSFNTNVGVPLTIFQVRPEDRALVTEMGANASGEIAELAAIAEPDIGVITCIGESHLEGFGSLDGVAMGKSELIAALPHHGVAVLNADDPKFPFLKSRSACRVLSFGFNRKADFRARRLASAADSCEFVIRGDLRVKLSAPGRHNAMNALAALAVADHLGLDLAGAAEALSDFRLPEMRYQMQLIGGVHVIFDGYNANPGSMHAALETFRGAAATGRKAAVLGDMLELGAESERLHGVVGEEAASTGLDALWAVGHFASSLAQAAKNKGMRGLVECFEDLDAVCGRVREFVRPGDTLLVKGSRGMKLERVMDALRSGVS